MLQVHDPGQRPVLAERWLVGISGQEPDGETTVDDWLPDRRTLIPLVLMGCMPGGTTSNLYTYFAKANLSLSVIVTVMTTLAAILLTPLLLLVYGGALAGDIEIPLGNVVVSLILLILPVVIGMAMRRWTANVDGALEVLGSVLGMVFILLLLVTWVPGNWPLLIATPWQVYVGAIALP